MAVETGTTENKSIEASSSTEAVSKESKKAC